MNTTHKLLKFEGREIILQPKFQSSDISDQSHQTTKYLNYVAN